jgi:hypothetical protein
METDRLLLPTEQDLLHRLREALTACSKLGWKKITHDAIASEIAGRLKDNSNISCYGGRPRSLPEECAGSEWLFDFSALLYKEYAGVRFVAQAAIIGETEWNPTDAQTDCDFEKLLIVDSIVCFFICGVNSDDEANRKLDRYAGIVESRKEYARVRGTRPPKFLLACYVEPPVGTERPAGLIMREV